MKMTRAGLTYPLVVLLCIMLSPLGFAQDIAGVETNDSPLGLEQDTIETPEDTPQNEQPNDGDSNGAEADDTSLETDEAGEQANYDAEESGVDDSAEALLHDDAILALDDNSIALLAVPDIPDNATVYFENSSRLEIYEQGNIPGLDVADIVVDPYSADILRGSNFTIEVPQGVEAQVTSIVATGSLIISGSGTLACSSTANNIGVKGDLTVTGASVTAASTDTNNTVSVSGLLRVTEGGSLSATIDGLGANYSEAIRAGSIEVLAGAVLAGTGLNAGYGVVSLAGIRVNGATLNGSGMTGVQSGASSSGHTGDLVLENGAAVNASMSVLSAVNVNRSHTGIYISATSPGPESGGSLRVSGGSQIQVTTDDYREDDRTCNGIYLQGQNKVVSVTQGSTIAITKGAVGPYPNEGIRTNGGVVTIDASTIVVDASVRAVVFEGTESASVPGGIVVQILNGSTVTGRAYPLSSTDPGWGFVVGEGETTGHSLTIDATSSANGSVVGGTSPNSGTAYRVGVSIANAHITCAGSLSGTAEGSANRAYGIWTSDTSADFTAAQINGMSSVSEGNTLAIGILIDSTKAVDPTSLPIKVGSASSVTARGGTSGLEVYTPFAVGEGSQIQAEGSSYGIYAGLGADITGVDTLVVATAYNVTQAGALVCGADLKVSDRAMIVAEAAEDATTTYGIHLNDFSLLVESGAKVTCTASLSGLFCNEALIQGANTILDCRASSPNTNFGVNTAVLQVLDNATVIGSAGDALQSVGIYGDSSITLSDSSATGTSGSMGVRTGMLLAKDSELEAHGAHVGLLISGGDFEQQGGTTLSTGAALEGPLPNGSAGAYVAGNLYLSDDAVLTVKALRKTAGADALIVMGDGVNVDASLLDAWTEDYDNTASPLYCAINAPNVTSFTVDNDGGVVEHYNTVFSIEDVPVDPTAKDPTTASVLDYAWTVGNPGKTAFDSGETGLIATASSLQQVAFSSKRVGSAATRVLEPVQLLTDDSYHQIIYGGVTTLASSPANPGTPGTLDKPPVPPTKSILPVPLTGDPLMLGLALTSIIAAILLAIAIFSLRHVLKLEKTYRQQLERYNLEEELRTINR